MVVRCNVLGLTVTTLDPRGPDSIFPPWVCIFKTLAPDWVPGKQGAKHNSNVAISLST